MNYECLLQEATVNNLYVIENATFESDAKGLINNDVIGINKNIGTETERACVLAEELGHYHTSSGNIIDMSNETNVKQERLARLWSYNKMIGLHGIIEAHKKRCSTRYVYRKRIKSHCFILFCFIYYPQKPSVFKGILQFFIIYYHTIKFIITCSTWTIGGQCPPITVVPIGILEI